MVAWAPYLDARTYAVALALAVVSGLLFGIVPVRQVLRANPYEVVKAASSGRAGRRWTLRDALLVVQIAICAVLVTSSLVAVRGLMRSLHGDYGFEPGKATLVSTNLAMAGYRADQVLPRRQPSLVSSAGARPAAPEGVPLPGAREGK